MKNQRDTGQETFLAASAHSALTKCSYRGSICRSDLGCPNICKQDCFRLKEESWIISANDRWAGRGALSLQPAGAGSRAPGGHVREVPGQGRVPGTCGFGHAVNGSLTSGPLPLVHTTGMALNTAWNKAGVNRH